MDTFNLINRAIDYIEMRLMQSITTAEVAAAIGYSRAHFSRLFHAMTGETLTGYIRKRRLSLAAYKLVTERCNILDLALDYQFQSQEAFTRSFKEQFRLSPGAYRRRGRFTGALNRITLTRPKIYRLPSRNLYSDLIGGMDKASSLDLSMVQDVQIMPVQLHAVVGQSTPFARQDPLTIQLWYR
jgi:AraC family transcriptional regulator